MTNNLFRQAGIGALAYVATDNTCSLLRCTFQVKFKDSLHATFSLQHTPHVYGFIDAQPFLLLYDADNLVPGTTTCMTAKRTLALTELSHIARNQAPEVRALSLKLKKPCAILCPNVSGSIAPQPSHEVHFCQLVDLTKALEITILFDWKWFQPKQIGQFLTIVSQPERFSGFPIDEKNLKGRRLEDWSVFSPTEQYLVESNEPPSYVDASRKRARHISHSPPLSPPPKRVWYVPEGSPTEKATTISSPSRPPSSTVDESTHTHPSRRLRSSLRAFLSARASAYCEKKITTICEDALYDAQYLRNAADDEFIETIEDQKLDIQSRKYDALEELQADIDQMVDEKFQELDATVADYMEEAGEQVERAINDKLDRYLNRSWVPDVASCAVEPSLGKVKREGRTARDWKRNRFRRRVR
ncbi:hypothetical protein DM02DRAFT_596174 [Periconia macrospinosa]|uniref:Uncharacterized protein n=1 Tax=Periconia macrospinosa TaxID=97972 RepID=A0A2V1DMF7_9PLEO|nr:hypothetical protein DM02DRAFT_596174 [Periconia macrospinosa]